MHFVLFMWAGLVAASQKESIDGVQASSSRSSGVTSEDWFPDEWYQITPNCPSFPLSSKHYYVPPLFLHDHEVTLQSYQDNSGILSQIHDWESNNYMQDSQLSNHDIRVYRQALLGDAFDPAATENKSLPEFDHCVPLQVSCGTFLTSSGSESIAVNRLEQDPIVQLSSSPPSGRKQGWSNVLNTIGHRYQRLKQAHVTTEMQDNADQYSTDDCVPPSVREDVRHGKERRAATYQPGLRCMRWQKGIPKGIIEEIYKRISAQWPKDLPMDTVRKYDYSTSRMFNRHPDLLKGVLMGNEAAWKDVLAWSKGDMMKARATSYGAIAKTRTRHTLVTVNWLAGKILTDDRDRILDRLSEYWGGLNRKTIYMRLLYYSMDFGKVQSPEPLLSKDDDTFQKAADIIWTKHRARQQRHPEAGKYDILHQYSPQYSVLDENGHLATIPVEKIQSRPTAARYNTGQAWLDESAIEQIDLVHNGIASQMNAGLHHKRVKENLMLANAYLEDRRDLLEAIIGGHTEAALQVLQAVADHPSVIKALPAALGPGC